MPGPLSLREKERALRRSDDDGAAADRERTRRTGRFQPPPPPMPNDYRSRASRPNGPKPVHPDRDIVDRHKTEIEMDDGGQFVFTNPSGQTHDISSPREQRRRAQREQSKQTKYEKMLEEQRLVEDVYIRARRKQREEREFERQRAMNRKFGRRGEMPPPPPPPTEEEEDPNTAWKRYFNSKSGNEVSWRDRGSSGRST